MLEKLRYLYNLYTEKFIFWIVWHLPAYLVYICAIRVGAHATVNGYPEESADDVGYIKTISYWYETMIDKQSNKEILK